MGQQSTLRIHRDPFRKGTVFTLTKSPNFGARTLVLDIDLIKNEFTSSLVLDIIDRLERMIQQEMEFIDG